MYFHFVTNTYLEKAGFSFSWEGKHTLINQNFKKVIHAFKLNYEKSQHIMAKPLNIIFWCEYADNNYNLWIYSTFRIEYCQRKVVRNSLWETFFCSVCGGVIDQAAGTMELPLVSGLYRNNMDCRFVFRQPEGKRVAITFTKFNLQQKAADGRCIDYVEVLRGLLKLFYWYTQDIVHLIWHSVH